MKHELMECINSLEVFVDLNDEHCFKSFKLSELLTESKTVLHFPDFLLQVPNRQQLINLLDLAIYVRNISFFILVLFYLRRCGFDEFELGEGETAENFQAGWDDFSVRYQPAADVSDALFRSVQRAPATARSTKP
jgi:hypothetical protein